MKKLLLAALAAVFSLTLLGRLSAQDSAPQAAPEAAAEPTTGPVADFKVLFERIGAKLRAGQQTEAALADEIKEFDVILARYADQKTDEVAMIAFMKARLYLEVLDNNPQAIVVLKKLQADFPDTDVGRNVGEVIEMLERQVAAEAALAVGKTFPDFSEQDTAGRPLSIAGLKGKVVLVDFWATWCGPCIAELPTVTAAYDKYRAKGFEIVGISLDDNRAALDAFVKDNKMAWPQFFDGQGWKNKLAQQYGINSIPATFLLDREGRIVAKNLRGEQLDQELSKLLK
jgi:thiol-disulfide isomerase/thioredoxin